MVYPVVATSPKVKLRNSQGAEVELTRVQAEILKMLYDASLVSRKPVTTGVLSAKVPYKVKAEIVNTLAERVNQHAGEMVIEIDSRQNGTQRIHTYRLL